MNNQPSAASSISIDSISAALRYLYSLSLNESSFRFRGQADFGWTLLPSIYRFDGFKRYQTVRFENIILAAKPKDPNPPLTHTTFDLEWLMLCQHYGVPTRLLDWSTDILVSLFFACENKNHHDADGALFVCNQNDYPLFAAYNENAMKMQELAFVSTNVVNPRMRMQSGCFMIWGHAPLSSNTTETYDLWEYQNIQVEQHFLTKLRIPKSAKNSILQELDKLYSISSKSVYLEKGYLENKFQKTFADLKENSRLVTVYQTDADKLRQDEEELAEKIIGVKSRNIFGNCLNIREMT